MSFQSPPPPAPTKLPPPLGSGGSVAAKAAVFAGNAATTNNASPFTKPAPPPPSKPPPPVSGGGTIHTNPFLAADRGVKASAAALPATNNTTPSVKNNPFLQADKLASSAITSPPPSRPPPPVSSPPASKPIAVAAASTLQKPVSAASAATVATGNPPAKTTTTPTNFGATNLSNTPSVVPVASTPSAIAPSTPAFRAPVIPAAAATTSVVAPLNAATAPTAPRVSVSPNATRFCHTCKQQIFEADSISASGKYFHMVHFTCGICTKGLVNGQFQNSNETFVCSGCVSNLKTCFACSKPIVPSATEQLVSIDDSTYCHYNCFKCATCSCSLAGVPMHTDRASHAFYCGPHAQEKFAPTAATSTCVGCGEGIRERVLIALDNTWHSKCFICAQCFTPLEGQQFSLHVETNSVYCLKDYQALFAAKCLTCNLPIQGQSLSLANANHVKLHPQCLRCKVCHANLQIDSFFQDPNDPTHIYCATHYEKLFVQPCDSCKMPIVGGNAIKVAGRTIHQHCFTCTQCQCSLTSCPYGQKDGRFYCQPHLDAINKPVALPQPTSSATTPATPDAAAPVATSSLASPPPPATSAAPALNSVQARIRALQLQQQQSSSSPTTATKPAPPASKPAAAPTSPAPPSKSPPAATMPVVAQPAPQPAPVAETPTPAATTVPPAAPVQTAPAPAAVPAVISPPAATTAVPVAVSAKPFVFTAASTSSIPSPAAGASAAPAAAPSASAFANAKPVSSSSNAFSSNSSRSPSSVSTMEPVEVSSMPVPASMSISSSKLYQSVVLDDDSDDEDVPPPPPMSEELEAEEVEVNLEPYSVSQAAPIHQSSAAEWGKTSVTEDDDDNCIISEILTAPMSSPETRPRGQIVGAIKEQGNVFAKPTAAAVTPAAVIAAAPISSTSTNVDNNAVPRGSELSQLLANRKKLEPDAKTDNSQFMHHNYNSIRSAYDSNTNTVNRPRVAHTPGVSTNPTTTTTAAAAPRPTVSTAATTTAASSTAASPAPAAAVSIQDGSIPPSELSSFISKGIEATLQGGGSLNMTDYSKKELHNLLHAQVSYQFMDYAPGSFYALRSHYGVSQESYVKSLVTDGIYGGAMGDGKSGMLFYFSKDRRFVLKTIKREELKFFRSILSRYIHHVQVKNPHSLLPRFLSMHKLMYKLPNGASHTYRFIVMNNLFDTPPGIEIKERFDLKGSTRNRKVEKEKIKPGRVLLDLNFNEMGLKINVGHQQKLQLLQQIRKDCEFLQNENIMDHSLLIGIAEVTDPTLIDPTQELDKPLEAQKLFGPLIAPPKSAAASSSSSSKGPRSAAPLLSVWQLNHGGVRAFNNNSGTTPRKEVYFLGIIDILQNFDLKKSLESAYKVIRFNKSAVSAIESRGYNERFVAYMESVLE